MGSIIKRGEIEAVVIFTGSRTFFGRAADMVNKASAEAQGRFAKIMFKNTIALFVLSFSCCAVILAKLLSEGINFLEALSTVVVILVASIPIAMQIVSTTVMAVGGRFLAQKKAIVARLSAIEELAGMTVLCSDKTGTLTQNKLQARRRRRGRFVCGPAPAQWVLGRRSRQRKPRLGARHALT